jgi:hypothetical protein
LNVDPLADYNPFYNSEHYIDGEHNGGVYNSGNNNPYIYCYQNPIIYIDPNGKQSNVTNPRKGMSIPPGMTEKEALSHIITINGKKYHKYTHDGFAWIGNKINSILGGDDDFFVEHKDYNPVLDNEMHEFVGTAAGELTGLWFMKGLGAVISRTGTTGARQILESLCFTKGTLVSTEKGLIPIEDIKIGDKVWSYNEDTGKTELEFVSELFRNTTESIVEITTGSLKIQCTPKHPFYAKGTWINAEYLKEGDYITSIKNELIKIDKIRFINSPLKVYNFEVQNNHNYYVSRNQILVHNLCFNGKFGREFYIELTQLQQRH